MGKIILTGKVRDVNATIKLIKPQRSNPHTNIINQMFAGIGVYEIMDSISWKKCKNETVKSRLTKYLETRNKIAHGSREPVTKTNVVQLKEYVQLLAESLDNEASIKATRLLGKAPW